MWILWVTSIFVFARIARYNDRKFYLCGRIVGPEWFE